MGPPRAKPAAPADPAPGPQVQATSAAPPAWPGPIITRRDPGRTITAPDPALQEPAPDFPGASLPRIAPDGRTSLQVYSRPFDAADKRPQVAVLMTGFGLSAQQSLAAVSALPGEISLGISPYTHDPELLLARAAEQGHEYFVTVPMESQGYPMNDSGPHALLTGMASAENARHLEWILSRMQGEVGLTNASDGLRGERFSGLSSAINPVLREAAQRGLLWVDGRPGASSSSPGRIGVSLVIDEQPGRAAIEAKLALLEQIARDHGRALGLAGTLTPVAVDRVTAWARGLGGRGIALVPVSALSHPEAP